MHQIETQLYPGKAGHGGHGDHDHDHNKPEPKLLFPLKMQKGGVPKDEQKKAKTDKAEKAAVDNVATTSDGGRSWQKHRLPPGCDDTYAIACG